MNPKPQTVVIERPSPELDNGRYFVKRIIGQDLQIEADIFKDGHDIVRAIGKWRKVGDPAWQETEMYPLINDRWQVTLPLTEIGLHEYTIEAWGDSFESWRSEFTKKFEAGITDLQSETLSGAALVEASAARAKGNPDAKALKDYAKKLRTMAPEAVRELLDAPEFLALMRFWPDRSFAAEYLPYLKVRVERKLAACGAWYEFFPRSAEGKADAGSTFRDCLPRVEDAQAMGFDIIYFPPIHPIGVRNRKGRNNSVTSEPGEPGVPYAIGNIAQGVNGGGHRDVAPELGTLEDFDWLVGEIQQRGMEVAIDFAIQCSPDHPYLRDHPDWFFHRPDGTIKYAENPPKKYEDIYPVNFYGATWQALWQEMRDVFLFWCGHGVRIFRVDNPHTKPVAFWEWVIFEVQSAYPDAIFLSEAFTRPKMMRALAKVGFTQSYTYFTWRNNKYELTEYLSELTQSEMKDYFRANFFPTTPDILPPFLQQGGRPAFLIRVILAATLSPVYGIYSGYELCENAAMPGKEEYLDSEKYQFKGRDWNAPGNIKETITQLNRIRNQNRALQEYTNLRFGTVDNDQILFYVKSTVAKDNILLILVSLDPYNPQAGFVDVPIDEFGFVEGDSYQVEDLFTGERFQWKGRRNFVSLNPHSRPAHILRLRRSGDS